MTEQIPFGRPDVGTQEIEAIAEVLRSGVLVHGEITANFEEAFAQQVGIKHAIAVASCTAGLHLALFAQGIQAGHRVAVPAMTHVATAHVVELLGATPVFVDVDPRTGNMNTEHLATHAEKGLDAIIPVHYLGLPCDMDKIGEIAKEARAFVVEDCALALGASYRGESVGGIGDAGSFSFYPVKHMTTIEGGMFTTNDDDLAHAVRKRRSFGYSKDLGARKRPGQYDVDALGFNYRMNEVEAAVGLHQLPKVPRWLEQRKQNFDLLLSRTSHFSDVTVFPDVDGVGVSSHYCFNVVLPPGGRYNRDRVQDSLQGSGVGTSIHYPSAVPLFTYYREKYGYKNGDFPVAEWLGANTISLPVGPHLGEDGGKKIADALESALRREINEHRPS